MRVTDWAVKARSGSLQRILALSQDPDNYSLAVGLPPTELLPARALARSLGRALEDPAALQLAPPLLALRAEIVHLMRARGVDCRPEQILVTAGAQQALDLAARVLVPAGHTVVTDPVVFPGFARVLEPLEALLYPIGSGPLLDIDVLEDSLAGGLVPALLYTSADGHNPTGAEMPAANRRRLVELAIRYRFPLLEDDVYGHLRLAGKDIPAIAAFDPGRDNVLYAGSLSKILAPGLRIGWVVAAEPIIEKLAIAKDAADIHCSNLLHHAAADFLAGGFTEHRAALVASLRERRQRFIAAAVACFPREVALSVAASGIFAWITLPTWCDAEVLLERAIAEQQVLFVPGSVFAARPGAGRHALRVCFTACTAERMEEGVARLGAAIGRYLASVTPLFRGRVRRRRV